MRKGDSFHKWERLAECPECGSKECVYGEVKVLGIPVKYYRCYDCDKLVVVENGGEETYDVV